MHGRPIQFQNRTLLTSVKNGGNDLAAKSVNMISLANLNHLSCKRNESQASH